MKKSKVYTITNMCNQRENIKLSGDILIVRGLCTGDDSYRAERHKVNEDYTNYIFGTIPNLDDFYVCVLRCKLYTCPKEKIIFIIDLCGFANNLWDPIEIYEMNNFEDHWKNIPLLIESMKKMYNGWDIRWYDEDSMYIFELTRDIFHNINYPYDLEHLIISDVIEKIHKYNSPKKINFKDSLWYYNKVISQNLWEACDETCSDIGTLNIWFGFDKDHKIFDFDNMKKENIYTTDL